MTSDLALHDLFQRDIGPHCPLPSSALYLDHLHELAKADGLRMPCKCCFSNDMFSGISQSCLPSMTTSRGHFK